MVTHNGEYIRQILHFLKRQDKWWNMEELELEFNIPPPQTVDIYRTLIRLATKGDNSKITNLQIKREGKLDEVWRIPYFGYSPLARLHKRPECDVNEISVASIHAGGGITESVKLPVVDPSTSLMDALQKIHGPILNPKETCYGCEGKIGLGILCSTCAEESK